MGCILRALPCRRYAVERVISTHPKGKAQPTTQDLAEGCHLALDNAERLLATAQSLTSTDPATASYLTAMACEEIGKAGILAARWRVLDGEGIYPEGLLDEVLAMPDVRDHINIEWAKFYKRQFCQHPDKTEAFYQMYGGALGDYEQVNQIDEMTIEVVDPIGNLKDKSHKAVRALRDLVEGSLYLDWDGQNGRWLTPNSMVNIAEFAAAVSDVMPKFREMMPPRP